MASDGIGEAATVDRSHYPDVGGASNSVSMHLACSRDRRKAHGVAHAPRHAHDWLLPSQHIHTHSVSR